MSQLYRNNNNNNTQPLKIFSTDLQSESKRSQISQSVPLTPIERNINYQGQFEKSAYKSLLQINNTIKKLEKLEEEKKANVDDDSLSQSSTSSLQAQPEYIYVSSNSIKPTFAPKLRRSYSQQLKKMTKSPRLSYIQPKIQPQSQDNFNRSTNNRINALSNNSITNSTSSNYKLFRQSFQNFNNINKKSSIDINNSTSDCSSVPGSPVFMLKKNINNCHNGSFSNLNSFNIFEGNDHNSPYLENNKLTQSESIITNNINKQYTANGMDEKKYPDYSNENSSLVINMCISGPSNIQSISNNSLGYTYNKTSKLKNPIPDESPDLQPLTSPSNENGKYVDDNDYLSDNSSYNFSDCYKITKSKNIPINSKRSSNLEYLANSNASSISEKFMENSFSNVNENRLSTINGQQIFPILYSDPSDFHHSKNDSFSYTVNIKKNLIKEFIETKERADNEIYELYSSWIEDKDSDFEKDDLSTNIFGGIKLLDIDLHNSSSLSSLLSLNFSNSSINISNDPNTFLDDSNESIFNNMRSNESLNMNFNSNPIIYSNRGSNENISLKTPVISDTSLYSTSQDAFKKSKLLDSNYNISSNNKIGESLNRPNYFTTKGIDINEPQRKAIVNKDVNIYKEKIKKNSKVLYFDKLKNDGKLENRRLSNSMDCLVLAYSNSSIKNKALQTSNSSDVIDKKKNTKLNKPNDINNHKVYNNIKTENKRYSLTQNK